MPKTSAKSTKTSKASASSAKKLRPAKLSAAASSGRQLKPPARRGFRLSKYSARPNRLPPSWRIARQAGQTLWQHWRLFLGITLIYTVLTIFLVRGLGAGANVQDLRDMLNGGTDKFVGSLVAFGLLLTSSGNDSNPVAGVYQTFLAIIASLAVVWTLRQVLAAGGNDRSIRIRDAFYQGMYPLIPVILVLVTIGLELIPMVAGAGLYALVISRGIAATTFEHILWGGTFFVTAIISFYMIIASVFALYIAALPDMTPVKALRSASGLVRYRRWSVLRKILFLLLVLFVGALIIMVPIILLITPLAPWVFFVLTMVGLPVIHAYMYTLYRELLV